MQIEQRFAGKFSPSTISDAIDKHFVDTSHKVEWSTLEVDLDGRDIGHDQLEEWIADYRRNCRDALMIGSDRSDKGFILSYQRPRHTRVKVRGSSRAEIEGVLEVFERAAERFPEPSQPEPESVAPVVFIGHGRSAAWRDLKDHLTDQHGYAVEAYETGARAGHHIRDVLASMTRRSTFAVLVMTGEDEQSDGGRRARQNVVHETGLFQGALGFDRAIVLVENGVEAFSNLDGIQQVRFDPGRIRETFGDVLATLKREFG